MTIDGVKVVDLERVADPRGSFVEFFRESWLPVGGHAVQGNVSRSHAGTLRAMHFHRHQWDYWFVVSGEAFVALADLRTGSPSEGAVSTLRLSDGSPQGLFIPPGVAHGFWAETDLVLSYLVSSTFDATDEYGIAWNDHTLGIDWPAADPILSERDRTNPALVDAVRDPIPYRPMVG